VSKEPNVVDKVVKWTIDRLERTIFFGLKFTLPRKFVSPLGYLGVLTGVTFIVLGVTGAILLVYYIPTADGAFESVRLIDETIPWGYALRNIHYHASNAMVFLALIHMYYQYFSGRFKIKNEVLWVTGVILGTLTVLEAFTGYDLILNERAMLAINIGASLNNAAPILGPLIKELVFGAGLLDVILRLYALHIFIVPLIMIVLVLVHFPRYLVFDIPISVAIVGAIFLTAGVFPVELGVRFDPNIPPGITVPEWYLTGLYAFIRTGVDKFFAGIVLPTLFIIMFLIVPFVDSSRKFSWKDRPFFSALGITSIGQIIVTTYWGFYVDPNPNVELLLRLFIDPTPYYAALIIVTAVSFSITYSYLRYIKAKDAAHKKSRAPPAPPFGLSRRWVMTALVGLIAFQVLLNGMALQAYQTYLVTGIQQLRNLALFEVGAVLLAFATIFHLYRFSVQQKF
jgi:ubiquinol-cytochrome c reductase cytochrome b subunit